MTLGSTLSFKDEGPSYMGLQRFTDAVSGYLPLQVALWSDLLALRLV
jgi:hypothetical protein